ncbi:hypothetical protein [Herbaspirillum sp. B65]|uniref:hypothetical protein n=1 Tax=Herbaspirillum sp. B65 TaxID=137708 RepID=UPI000A02180A|nr:hypothetical protein [Herbaspirillum sp. B65]
MFEKKDFQNILGKLPTKMHRLGCYRGVSFHVYPPYAFNPPDGEQTIRITRAPKADSDNGIDFWLCSEWLQGWTGREEYFAGYLSGSAFEPISERSFNDLVADRCVDLIVRPELPLKAIGKFLGAVLLYSMKTDFIVSLVAEYEDEFIHFYWDTTA